MRTIGLGILVILSAVAVTAQEDPVTVNVAPVEVQEMFAWWVQDVVRHEQPMVRVRGVKIRLDDGAPVRVHAQPSELVRFHSTIKTTSASFRVYRGDEGVGIFKYRMVSDRGRSPGKGLWLEAMPLDRDETFQALTRDVRDSADIEALLDMDVEEAERATRREEMLEQKIAAAIEREWEQLKSGQAFLVPTHSTNRE